MRPRTSASTAEFASVPRCRLTGKVSSSLWRPLLNFLHGGHSARLNSRCRQRNRAHDALSYVFIPSRVDIPIVDGIAASHFRRWRYRTSSWKIQEFGSLFANPRHSARRIVRS